MGITSTPDLSKTLTKGLGPFIHEKRLHGRIQNNHTHPGVFADSLVEIRFAVQLFEKTDSFQSAPYMKRDKPADRAAPVSISPGMFAMGPYDCPKTLFRIYINGHLAFDALGFNEIIVILRPVEGV